MEGGAEHLHRASHRISTALGRTYEGVSLIGRPRKVKKLVPFLAGIR
jgi:hypothetical protein